MYLEMSIGRLEAALAIALLMIGLAGVVLVVMKWAGGRHPGDLNRLRSF
jgi:ABC-type sulfate transport system permease component